MYHANGAAGVVAREVDRHRDEFAAKVGCAAQDLRPVITATLAASRDMTAVFYFEFAGV
jgi:hypothetical protein